MKDVIFVGEKLNVKRGIIKKIPAFAYYNRINQKESGVFSLFNADTINSVVRFRWHNRVKVYNIVHTHTLGLLFVSLKPRKNIKPPTE